MDGERTGNLMGSDVYAMSEKEAPGLVDVGRTTGDRPGNFLKDLFNIFLQRFNVYFLNIPNDLEFDLVVTMNDNIPGSEDRRPGYFRVF